MASVFEIPLINPLRFHHNTLTLGSAPNPAVSDSQFNTVHMDADFFIRTLSPYVKKEKYAQPWQTNDVIPIHVVGKDVTTGLYLARIVDANGAVVRTFNMVTDAGWALSGSQKIWEYYIPLYDVPEGFYLVELIKYGAFTEVDTFYISEPIHVKENHEGTVLIKYRHRKNDYGTYFETGITYQKRIFGKLMEFKPESKFFTYENTPMDLEMVSGYAYREFMLHIGGDGHPMPEYEYDILNRAFLCSDLSIDGIKYTRLEGAQLELNVGKDLALTPSKLGLRQKSAANSLVHPDLPNIVLTTLPDSERYYLKEFSYPSSSPVSVQKFFKSRKRMLGYLNYIFTTTHKYVSPEAFFTVDDEDKLVIKTTTSDAHSDYDGSVLGTLLSSWLEITATKIGSAEDIVISATAPSGTKNLAFLVDNQAQTVIAATTYTTAISQTYTVSGTKTVVLFSEAYEDMDLSGSDVIITDIGGQMPSGGTGFFCNNNLVSNVKNNLFLSCRGSLLQVDLSGNALSTAMVNKCIKYIYQCSKALSLDSGGNLLINSNNPPSSGLDAYYNGLLDYDWSVTHD